MGGRRAEKKPAAERETAAGAEGRIASGQNRYKMSGARNAPSNVPARRDALASTLGAGPDRGARGWQALHFDPHQLQQFPKSYATGSHFREEQLADITALVASDVRAARLALRFSRWLLRFCLSHGRPPPG